MGTWGHSVSTVENRAARRTSRRDVGDLRRIELRGLSIATVLVLLGVLATYWAKSSSFDAIRAQLEDGSIVNLTTVEDAEVMHPALSLITDADRQAQVADHLARFLRGEVGLSGDTATARPALPNVGRLALVRTDEGRVLTSGEFRTLKPAFIVRTPAEYQRMVLGYTVLFLFGFYLVHVYWRVLRPRTKRGPFTGDPLLLPILMLLTGIGFMMMISLRDPLRDFTIFTDFAFGVFGSCLVILIASQINYEPLKNHWTIPFFLSLGLFVLLQVFGSGPAGSGVKVNISVPGLGSVQPAELIKVLMVFFLAGYFANYGDYLRELDERRSRLFKQLPVSLPRMELFIPVVAAVLITLAAFFVVKEMGTALVISLAFFLLYATVRKRAGLPLLGTAAVVAMFWVGFKLRFSQTIVNRILIWQNPWDNLAPMGGDHIAQARWAFASGSLFGQGPGRGDPSYVPEAHTDMILSAIGEELGWIGVAVVGLLYIGLIARIFRAALTAGSPFKFFLALGLGLVLAVQIILITGGVSGVIPLTGIVNPFLSFGRSSMLLNGLAVGIVAGISADRADPDLWPRYETPVRWISLVLGAAFLIILLRIGVTQLVNPNRTLAREAQVLFGDGQQYPQQNPRLTAFRNQLSRGDIYDRNGVLLATSTWETLEAHRESYESLGIDLDAATNRLDGRHYPFDALTFPLLGDVRSRPYWAASNTSFIERDYSRQLLGYDDLDQLVTIYRSPIARRRFLDYNRDLTLTLDIRLQQRVYQILERHRQRAEAPAAAAVLLDAETGDVLAAVSLPGRFARRGEDDPTFFADRVRYALRPPGSTFKVVTTMAAFRTLDDATDLELPCNERLPGPTSLEEAIIRSCNDYFKLLATEHLGATALLETAALFGIEVANPNTPEQLAQGNRLEQAGFGQGEVTATPLEMALVAATIANDGDLPAPRWTEVDDKDTKEILSTRQARRLAAYMGDVITDARGTAYRSLRNLGIPVVGKTGTAEIRGQRDHAWFIGYAPAEGRGRKIAFAVLIEHGGGGGSVAAPAVGDMLLAARDLGLLNR